MNKLKENQILNSAESSFPNKSMKYRSFKKVVNALPKSSKSLFQEFNLRTDLNNKKLWRLENDLIEDEVEWLCQIMDKLNIIYTNVEGKRSIISR